MPPVVPALVIKAYLAAFEVLFRPAGALIVLLELTALAAAFNPVLLADKNMMEVS